ncbi:hypothetical protein [Symbiobacterium thermophilum]|uniref:Uncharacterized protein n=1 Tax=Symbiobacterium thermophilum TaxID=2734 RepID=A0A953LDI8_SYMTR|nr:hypothetical protein [Symbiobacterium thermophilum]MBY6275465.1 hypothetical protein [Symbiobacterium thermophilum]
MLVTHGDTIVFRPDPYRRVGTSYGIWDGPSGRRGRSPEHRPGPSYAGGGDRLESLLWRIDALEERVARLEARIPADGPRAGRSRQDGSGDGGRPARSGGVADGYGAGAPGARQVRVTLHAGPGAQVSVGQVRLFPGG